MSLHRHSGNNYLIICLFVFTQPIDNGYFIISYPSKINFEKHLSIKLIYNQDFYCQLNKVKSPLSSVQLPW